MEEACQPKTGQEIDELFLDVQDQFLNATSKHTALEGYATKFAASRSWVRSGFCWRRILHTDPRAERADLAPRAVRLPRDASAPAMPDQPVAEECPILLRHELHQVRLDLLWRRFLGEPEAAAQALHVRVHHHAHVDVVGVA